MREKFVVGNQYEAGTVIGDAGHIGRHIAVWFICAHCPDGIGRAKFTCLKAPESKKHQTKSCRCKKKARFDKFTREAAARFPWDRVLVIGESYALDHSVATAKRFKITKWVANYVWQRWCSGLESLPLRHRQAVFKTAQRSSQAAADKHGHTISEVRRICLHWRRGQRGNETLAYRRAAARKQLQANGDALFRAYAPVGSLTGSIVDDAVKYMAWGCERAHEHEKGRYPGELTPKEFRLGLGRSDYQWVYQMLRAMHSEQVNYCFGQLGIDFLELCGETLAQRRRRNKAFQVLRESSLGMSTPRSPSKGTKNLVFLPAPTASPIEIAGVIARYYAALRAA